MDISSVNSDLIRGNVTTIILGCLCESDKYGYEIMKEIEDKSNSQYALKQATLYNQLKRLEKQGLVSSYDGNPDDTGGGKRRYYSLTSEGRAYLKKKRANTSIRAPFWTSSFPRKSTTSPHLFPSMRANFAPTPNAKPKTNRK